MTAHDQLFASDALAAAEPVAAPPNWLRSIGLRLTGWANTCADYYAAAAMYEQLSNLSDVELARRGLARATLAHDVCASCEGS